MQWKYIQETISEIYDSRNILYALIKKSLIGRYKNSFLGFAWHFIMPLVLLGVYYVAFETGIRSATLDNFVIFLASGIFLFNFTVTSLSASATCISANGSMIKKIYFPREIFVLSQCISSFIILLVGYSLTFCLILLSGFEVGLGGLLFMPIILLLSFLFVLGYTFLLSALNTYVRDIQHFLNSITMAFMFITPIYFLAEDTTGFLEIIVWVNPFTYYIEAIHSCIYFGTIPPLNILSGCIFFSMIFSILGIIVFEKLKKGFAERL